MIFFYLLSFLFIWMKIYELKYSDRLYLKKNIESIDKNRVFKDILFYISNIIFIFWIFIGLFTNLHWYFIGFIVLYLIGQINVIKKNKKITVTYRLLSFFISIVLNICILIKGLF